MEANQYKSQIRLIYYYAIISGLVNLTLPLGIQAIINFLQTGEITVSWILLVLFVLFGIAWSGNLQIKQLRIVEDIQQDIFSKATFDFSYRIPKIKKEAIDQYHAPELVNRFFDVLTIQKGLPKILIDFTLASFQIIIGLLMLIFYSSYFILLMFTFFIIIYLIFKITGPKGLKTSIKESKQKYAIVHWIEEIARNYKTFKFNHEGNLHLHKTDGINVGYLEYREAHFKILLKQFKLFVAFKVWVAASLLLLGGLLVFKEQMNIGQFVASEIIIILILNSIEKIIKSIETIYDVLTAVDKIGYITDLPLQEDKGDKIINTTQSFEVSIEKGTYYYETRELTVFENVQFDIPSNGKAVILGNSGSGKTTLLNVIAGLIPLKSGKVMYNQFPISFFNSNNVYQNIGYINNETTVFEGSILENITLNKPVDEEWLNYIITKLKLDFYIKYLPKGLHSTINSTGRNTPKSIIQKIIIARMLVAKPKLILLEDPLHFINENEKNDIIDFMMGGEANATVIVIPDHEYWMEKATHVINL